MQEAPQFFGPFSGPHTPWGAQFEGKPPEMPQPETPQPEMPQPETPQPEMPPAAQLQSQWTEALEERSHAGRKILWSFLAVIFLALIAWGARVLMSDKNVISAKEGGRAALEYEGRLVEVIVPAAALEEDTAIGIVRTEKGEIIDAYKFTPENLKFSKPVTLAIPYKKNPPASFALKWIGSEGEQVLKYTVDKKTKQIRTEVSEF